MEPCAPGTEDDPPIMYSTLNKQENEQERLLRLKAILRNGKYENVFELSYINGAEHWFCRACECPVMGRVFQHEVGKRHSLNLANTNRHLEKHRRDEPQEEPMTLEIAPGEPVPPGFEDEVGRVSQIQERLDGFKVGPLVALEYLLELQDDDSSKEPVYLCILCDKRGDPRTVLTHLASYNHISQYLQKHFPTSWRALVPYMTKQYKRNWQTTLQKIAEGIEKKFGRLKPYPIDKDKFEKDRMHYLQIVGKGRHFSEQSGYTFEELVVHDELTKTHEEEKSYEATSTNNWGTSVIQKPFRKKDPSPPVVGAPFKRTKGNAQTNPRRQEPAYVPVGQPAKTAVAAKSQASGKSSVAAPKSDQRRRSLSSVSSISSSDLSDNESRNTIQRKKREPYHSYRNERQLPYSRRRSPSPRRRQPSPRHRSPLARRRSPSPRRRSPSPRRRNIPLQKQVDKKTEEEMERIRKMEEYKKLARAIENDLQNTLKQHEKNPEKHSQYNEEWKKFWNRRYKELKAEGVDVAKHDFKPEWIEFWNKRMVELHSDELRSRKDALRKRLGLPEEINPIKFKIGQQASPKRLPMAAQPDHDDEVILIDDKDDDIKPPKRSHSPWEEETPKTRAPLRRSQSPQRKRTRGKSPVRSRSRERYLDTRSKERSRSKDKSSALREGRDLPKTKELVRERDLIRSKEFERERDHRDSRDRRSHSRETSSSRNRRTISPRSRSRERSWDRRDVERKRMEYRESSFERDLRSKERVRTVAELPWGRDNAYRMTYDEYYKPPAVMRDVTRKPVMLSKEPPILPPEEEDDDVEVNVVDVLRILTALEERLGSLGPKVIDLLAQALALEKKEANSSETLLDNDINCVLFETVKEKLKGQLLTGLVDMIQERAFKKAIKKIASLIHLAGQRKSKRDKMLPKVTPVSVPGVGTVDKAAIAKQIANALILQGKTDVTQAELEQLIDAVVGMAEASKNSNKPITTATFLQQIAEGTSFVTKSQSNSSAEREEQVNSASAEKDSVDLEKLTEPLTPSPGKNSVSNMENLSDSDLQTLLQNFKDLSTDEQHNLINYLKKLEYQEPERVETLRKFVNLDPNAKAKSDATEAESLESSKKDDGDRESPFSNRLGSLNPSQDDLTQIESDEEDMKNEDKDKNSKDTDKDIGEEKSSGKINEDSEEEDYTFDDVVKSVSKNVKDNEMAHNKRIVEESMKFERSKTKPESELSSAKDLISNLMSNINKSNTNSGSVDLLGLGGGRSNPNPPVSTMANTLDLAALNSINVASLTSIVNNVKNMTSTDTDRKPSSPTKNAGKLNFDPAQLDKTPLTTSRVAPGATKEDQTGREFAVSTTGPVPGQHLEGRGPDRYFERGLGGPGPYRGVERGPMGGLNRDSVAPGRDYERGPTGPDRTFNRDFERGPGPDRGVKGPLGLDRPLGGPERTMLPERGMERGFERGVMGLDRGPGPERGFGGPERGFVAPERGFVPPERGFVAPDRSFVAPDRGLVGMNRGFAGPDRSFGMHDRNQAGMDRGFERVEPLGPGGDRGFGGRDRGYGGGGNFEGVDRGFSGPDRNFNDRGIGGPDRGFDRPFGGAGGFGTFGNDPQRLQRPGNMDQRNNPRFAAGPEYGRANFNRW